MADYSFEKNAGADSSRHMLLTQFGIDDMEGLLAALANYWR